MHTYLVKAYEFRKAQSARIKQVPVTDKCFSELPVKVNECREARDILEIQRIRLGAVFGFESRGVRIRLARCSDLIGAAFGFTNSELSRKSIEFPKACGI